MAEEDYSLDNGEMIDNEEIFLDDVLNHELPTTRHFKVATGYLFFSGFAQVSDALRNVDTIEVVMGTKTDYKTAAAISKGYDAIPPEHFQKIIKQGLDAIKSDDEWELVDYLVDLIKDHRMTVRIYTERIFHAKMYIFERETPELNTVIGGSANYSEGGEEGNIENSYFFNTAKQYKQHRKKFDVWNQVSQSFDIQLLELIASHPRYCNYKQRKEAAPPDPEFQYLTPVQFYRYLIEQLDKYYLFGHVDNLIPFQRVDYRIARGILKKYGGVFIASSVGLGKSYVALQIIVEFVRKKKKVLFLLPPNIKEQWADYLLEFGLDAEKDQIITLSHWEIAQEDFVPDNYTGFSAILVDESHNFRNSGRNRLRNFLKLRDKNRDAECIFLTATPINNSFLDLYNQVHMMYSEKFRCDDLIQDYKALSDYAALLTRKKLGSKNQTDSIGKGNNGKIGEDQNKAMDRIKRLRQKLVVRSTRQDLTDEDKKYLEKKLNVTGLNIGVPVLTEAKYLHSGKGYTRLFRNLVGFITRLNLPHILLINPKAGEFIASIYKVVLYKRFESSIYALHQSIQYLRQKNQNLIDLLDRQLPITDIREDENHIKKFKSLVTSKSALSDDDLATFEYIDDNAISCPHCGAIITEEKAGTTNNCPFCHEVLTWEPLTDDSDEREKYRRMALCDIAKIDLIEDIITKYILQSPKTYFDAKLDVLSAYIRDHPDEKILVFSQFTDTVEYIFNRLIDFKLSTNEKPIRRVHGQTPRKMEHAVLFSPKFYKESYRKRFTKRYHLPDDYFEKQIPTQVLIATDTFSEGMNLQEADIIVNYDLPWNPIRIAQRIGRAYRIDNPKSVAVMNILPDAKIDKEVHLLSTLKAKIQNIIEIIGSEHCILSNEEQQMIEQKQVDDLDLWKEKMELRKSSKSLLDDEESERSKLPTLDQYLIRIIEDKEIHASSPKIIPAPGKIPFTILPYDKELYWILSKTIKGEQQEHEYSTLDATGNVVTTNFPNDVPAFETKGIPALIGEERKTVKALINKWLAQLRKTKSSLLDVNLRESLDHVIKQICAKIRAQFNALQKQASPELETIRQHIFEITNKLNRSPVQIIHKLAVEEFRRKWFKKVKNQWKIQFSLPESRAWKHDGTYEEKITEFDADLTGLFNKINVGEKKRAVPKDVKPTISGVIVYRLDDTVGDKKGIESDIAETQINDADYCI